MEFIYSETIFYILIFLRISGLFFFTPFFSSKSITIKIKLTLIFLITLIIYPTISKDISIINNLTFFKFNLMIIKELFMGGIIGYFLMLLFSVVQTAAQIYSMDMGFGMVNVLDPISQIQLPILGQFKYLFMLTIFFILGIHRKILMILINSFHKFELGKLNYNHANLAQGILEDFAYYFLIAIKLALPVLGVLFLIDIVLGIMAKIAPQMNVFFIGMPLKILVGFLFLIAFVPYMLDYFKYLLEDGYIKIIELMGRVLM
ncbi:MAG: flagellar biosynthetic protein FliR [Fusobacteriia bacterium 4572_132]|nr:MAG: flagellar biosynthetic protein FliR [Fusobacteriia bacterium 4572_132]